MRIRSWTSQHKWLLGGFVMLCLIAASMSAEENQPNADDRAELGDVAWGRLVAETSRGVIVATIDSPAPQKLPLPTPFPNITAAFEGTPEWPGKPLEFSFNPDATELVLHGNAQTKGDSVKHAVLQVSTGSAQFSDGRIVLSALDAKVVGKTARLETHPGNHRIGFWTNADDQVAWEYDASRWGKYAVYLTYSLAGTRGSKGSDAEIEIAGTTLPFTLASTGSWYRYATISIGDVLLETAGKHTIAVKCVSQRGPAVMNLKAITLLPTCEGRTPVQAADGTILLHAQDSIVQGVNLRWEPNPKKRTVGYWSNVTDQVYWDFKVERPGKFNVKILQGCGTGQGGSTVDFQLYRWNDANPTASLRHVVEDTGHWQNFVAKSVGEFSLDSAGMYRIRVEPRSKTGAAVMDLRQILLSP